MKCVRCGKEYIEEVDVCGECGFSFVEHKEYSNYVLEEDPRLPKNEKIKLIDNPVLTLIFGLISLVAGGLYFFSYGIVVLFLVLVIVFFALTFIFSLKPTKVKLKPLREFGIVLGYISIGMTIFKTVSFLISYFFS